MPIYIFYGVLARFHRPGGGGFQRTPFERGGGEFAHQKNYPGVLPGDGQAWN